MAEPLLAGRVAVVTGAGQGIGREIARSLTGHGGRVLLIGAGSELIDGVASGVGAGRRR